MSDNLDKIWQSHFQQRSAPLDQRYSGMFRALVVETNDPLRAHRIRFKMPELHDWDLKPEDCPWAVPAAELGTKRCGRWVNPCIGDFVWIQFEKNHPYGPVYTGFADPTRRRFYPLASVYGKTPRAVDIKGEVNKDNPREVVKPIIDYDLAYLPKDERPMSHGVVDRYGNLDIHSAVGFFPKEHAENPPPPDTDELTKSAIKFQQSTDPPEPNNPDSKYMARVTKYGQITLQSDAGYIWKRDDAGNGEFKGDVEADEDWEVKRWLYVQKLLHENKPKEHDQRRLMLQTRYGHKLEMRDVGWNKTRKGEWDDQPRTIGSGSDERWIKLRTKGGHLIEMCDIGFDPEEDDFVKRPLLEEVGGDELLDKEDKYPKNKTEWNKTGDRDARFMRFTTRAGRKMVIDDRGSHEKQADDHGRKNKEIGIGILLKGRATPGTKADEYAEKSGNPIGYYWQFDERPEHNTTTWGTPCGQAIEMDDNEELLTICSKLPDLPTSWKNLEDNEFLEESIASLDAAHKTHHLIIDHGRDLIRLKTRAGLGEGSKSKRLGESANGEHAGLEIHDAPADDPWMEIVDIDKRGIWFSSKENIGIWRSKSDKSIHIWMDDNNGKVVIRNAESGKIQIYCVGNVELISDRMIAMQAPQISMRATDKITMTAGGSNYTFESGALRQNADIHAPNVYAFLPTAARPVHVSGLGTGAKDGGGVPAANLTKEALPTKVEPDNRL